MSDLNFRKGFRIAAMAIGCWMLSLSVQGAPQMVEVDTKGIQDGAMLLHPKVHKLYAGRGNVFGEREEGLFVIDLDPKGGLAGTDERLYPNSPDPLTPPFSAPATPSLGEPKQAFRKVTGMALSADGRKLYLGLYGVSQYASGYTQGRKEQRPLVVYDLDEKGEPKGKPRSYEVGATTDLGINNLVFDSGRNLLHATRLCVSGVYRIPLQQGEPGTAVFSRLGSHLKYSMLVSDRTGELLFGTLGKVEIAFLDGDGEVDPHSEILAAGKTEEGLLLARVDHVLFFMMGKQLWSWPFAAGWKPEGKPRLESRVSATEVWVGSRPFLYVSLGEFEGTDPKQRKFLGSRIARFKPDAKGNLDQPDFISDLLPRKSVRNLVVDEANDVIYTTTCPR